MSFKTISTASALAAALTMTAPFALAGHHETTTEKMPAATEAETAAVRDAVLEAFGNDAHTDDYDLEVRISGGVIVLHGMVKTHIEREVAENLTEKAAPGFAIQNEIVVGRGDAQTPQIPGAGAGTKIQQGGGVTTTAP